MSAEAEEVKQPLNTAAIIARMVDIRDERRTIRAKDKELVSEWRSFELELLTRLDEQEMAKVTVGAGTASITERILPNVEDWDAFYKHIHDTESYYLLERRPAAAAFREIVSSGDFVPGVVPYTQRQISLRKK
jgi:hypothetical protein